MPCGNPSLAAFAAQCTYHMSPDRPPRPQNPVVRLGSNPLVVAIASTLVWRIWTIINKLSRAGPFLLSSSLTFSTVGLELRRSRVKFNRCPDQSEKPRSAVLVFGRLLLFSFSSERNEDESYLFHCFHGGRSPVLLLVDILF
ncbi:hypothetical protein NL676_013620 [Syzygium grande]|nr:hypothetical protein NL676_013620 [Syzygium grande]